MASPLVRTAARDDVMRIACQEFDGRLVRGERDCYTQPIKVFEQLFCVRIPRLIQYGSLAAAARYVRNAGGASATASGAAKAAGLVPCAPVPGAIGRIEGVGTELALTLAICVGDDEWITKALDGAAFVRGHKQSWGVPWG